MRVISAVFAILGIIISGVMAVFLFQALETITNSPEYKAAIALSEEEAKQNEKFKKALDEHHEIKAKLYGLCATPIVGIIALVLVMKRMPLISGLLFAVAGFGPYVITQLPMIFIFCGWFVVAGLFAALSGGGTGSGDI